MRVVITKNFDESGKVAADLIKEVIDGKSDAKLGLATGATATTVYKSLIELYNNGEVDFKNVRTVNLDEYCGLEGTHEQSYRYFMDTHLFNNVNIDKKNTFVASGIGDVNANAEELETKVNENGAIDIQLLGIGRNGHIAFNEAGDTLLSVAHVETLSDSTIEANSCFFEKREDVPTQAITMGMSNIMSAKKIVLLATGTAKKDAIRGLIYGNEITTQNPSTMLKMHSDVVVVIDEELAAAVNQA